jgi:hypothetical protein
MAAKKQSIKPGRKSSAELAALVMPGPHVVERPPPPYELTDQESAVWIQVVNSMPADYFAPSQHALLIQYCRHVVASNRCAMLVEQFCKQRKINKSDMPMLLSMQATESNAIIKLSRAMLLSHNSIYRADSTGRLSPLKSAAREQLSSPWDSKYDTKDNADDD